MATSIKPTTNTSKRYLDFEGLNALWDNICDKFSPQWKTVSWEFIRDNNPTHNTDNVVLPFQNLSNPPTEQGVANHSELTNTWYTINAATQETAGVMSAADKTKLDGLESAAEQAVTVKTIKVGNTLNDVNNLPASALTISDTINKEVAFGLSYDSDSDLLSIMDLNYKPDPENKPNEIVPRALSSVHILGDALKKAFIESAELTHTGKDGEEGTFIKIVFITETQDPNEEENTDRTIWIDVEGLIDIYTAGEGISIQDSEISIVAPTTTTKGGIISKKVYDGTTNNVAPTVQNLSTQPLRYFGIETDSNGNAFVNAPSATAAKGTSTAAGDTIDNTVASDTFTVVTDVDFSLDTDTDTYTVTPKTTTFTVAMETKLSMGTPVADTDSPIDIKFGDGDDQTQSFTVISDIAVEDHKITLKETTYNITETAISFVTPEEDLGEITLKPGESKTIDVLSDITAEGTHTLKDHKYTSIKVENPESIEIDYIEGLQWVIPITKKHLPNEE